MEPTEYTVTTVGPTPRLLLQKLLTIGGEIGHLKKDAQNPHHRYMYASEKAIKEAVYPKFRQHGVFFSLEIQGQPFEIGNALMVPFRYRFIDVDSGEEFSGGWLGSGRMGDDKGLYIAITGAIKYALTTHCGIVTGDDPEAEDETTQMRAGEPPPWPPQSDHVPVTVQSLVIGARMLECANCETRVPSADIKPFPSKYDAYKFGVKIGDPVYRCPECSKYVPVREA